MYSQIKKMTRTAQYGAEKAIEILKNDCDWLNIVKIDGVWVDQQADGEYEIVLLRNKESFVAIPGEYYGENSQFTATNGEDVMLTHNDDYEFVGVVAA